MLYICTRVKEVVYTANFKKGRQLITTAKIKMKNSKLTFVDCAGNKTVVAVSNSFISSLKQVKDVVLNETKYFENDENANAYLFEKNLVNPNNGKSYKRLLTLSNGLKKSNKETNISTEEFKTK